MITITNRLTNLYNKLLSLSDKTNYENNEIVESEELENYGLYNDAITNSAISNSSNQDTNIPNISDDSNSNISLSSIESIEDNIDFYINELKDKGYTIIPNVYNNEEINTYWDEFNLWRQKVQDLDYLHNIIDFNGIFKHHQVGHQRFAWLARTNQKILKIFKKIWNTDELVCSFDGCCYYPSDYIGMPSYWTHSDQSSLKKGVHCYQSFLSLTNNKERTLIIYENTHNYHEEYFEIMGIEEPKDWNIIDQNYLMRCHYDKEVILDVKQGDLVIWDSRTFHQNTCGPIESNEERLVQYLCYLPKNNIKNTEKEQKQRQKFFDKKRTTSHWPYPMNPVPEQPNFYNYYYPDQPIYIDYNSLPPPVLDDLLPEIKKLL